MPNLMSDLADKTAARCPSHIFHSKGRRLDTTRKKKSKSSFPSDNSASQRSALLFLRSPFRSQQLIYDDLHCRVLFPICLVACLLYEKKKQSKIHLHTSQSRHTRLRSIPGKAEVTRASLARASLDGTLFSVIVLLILFSHIATLPRKHHGTHAWGCLLPTEALDTASYEERLKITGF